MPRRSSVAVVAFLCAAASLVMAQQPVPSAPAGDSAIADPTAPRAADAPAAALSLAPTAERAPVGGRAAAAPDPVPAPKRGDTSQNRARMIVDAAALIVGAVIGGTAGTRVMVGGGIAGLFGLYQYLQ